MKDAELMNWLLKQYDIRILDTGLRKGVASIEQFAYKQTPPEITDVLNTVPRLPYTAVPQDSDDDRLRR